MNLLTDIIPAAARKYIYAAYALAGIIVGALAVAGIDVGKAPDVIAYLGIALGLTAAANTTTTDPVAARPITASLEGAELNVDADGLLRFTKGQITINENKAE